MKVLYFLTLCFLLNSNLGLTQTEQVKGKFEYFFKVGPIFNSFEPNIFNSRNSEAHNRWDLELGVYHNRTGVSILARYITGRSFINNPIFRQSPPSLTKVISEFKKGDLFRRENNVSNFSFLLSVNVLAKLTKKHRLEIGLGTMIRTGETAYFNSLPFWDLPDLTIVSMDKWGILGRLSYTFRPAKYLSLSLNGEYARFKENPKDIYNLSFLVGTYF
jgi:hypothetical protein